MKSRTASCSKLRNTCGCALPAAFMLAPTAPCGPGPSLDLREHEPPLVHARDPDHVQRRHPRPQMSSCYLLHQADSIEGIFETMKMTAQISKYAGGIGLSIDNVRAKGSRIRGTNGTSNGILPMLRVFNNAARYVDQGGGRRKGSIAMYLSPWHPDIFQFLDIRLITGKRKPGPVISQLCGLTTCS